MYRGGMHAKSTAALHARKRYNSTPAGCVENADTLSSSGYQQSACATAPAQWGQAVTMQCIYDTNESTDEITLRSSF
jgi:hypothetical protein